MVNVCPHKTCSPLFYKCIFIGIYFKRMMKFVGMCVKALPFPHFHNPKLHLLLLIISNSFFYIAFDTGGEPRCLGNNNE